MTAIANTMQKNEPARQDLTDAPRFFPINTPATQLVRWNAFVPPSPD
jgi:hypothetical protein